MNKLTKISATALIALFLAACDKPADKAPVAEPAKTTESAPAAQTAPAEKPAAETAPVANTEVAPAAKPAEAPNAEALADYQKLVNWNAEQEKALAPLQAELQQKFASQDPKQIQEGLTQFTAKVSDVIKSLDAIEVSDAQVTAFKEKTKSVLALSSDLIGEQVKAMSAPQDQAAQHAVQQKAQTLVAAGQELQQLQVELQQRFSAK